MYIVIEGQDATGKSTQVEMLAEYFRKQGKKVATIHEPDGDIKSAQDLRKIIKDKSYDLNPLAIFLLFSASRVELWKKIAEPILKENGVIISARNWWSSLAYQGYGQGLSRDKITKITKSIMPKQYIEPTKSVILTLADNIRLQREASRDNNSKNDTFESKSGDFQQKVNSAYINIARDFNVKTIDTSGTVDEIFENIKTYFQI